MFVAVVVWILLIITAMNLSTGSGSIGIYRWIYSIPGELVTFNDHGHYYDVRQSVAKICVSVAASHPSFYIIWGIKLLPPKYQFWQPYNF